MCLSLTDNDYSECRVFSSYILLCLSLWKSGFKGGTLCSHYLFEIIQIENLNTLICFFLRPWLWRGSKFLECNIGGIWSAQQIGVLRSTCDEVEIWFPRKPFAILAISREENIEREKCKKTRDKGKRDIILKFCP